jgi:hypothetical protein
MRDCQGISGMATDLQLRIGVANPQGRSDSDTGKKVMAEHP